MSDNSLPAKTLGGRVTGFFLASAALLMLSACIASQELVMLQPTTDDLTTTYHVKELVMHKRIQGLRASKSSLEEAKKLSAITKDAIDRELQTTLQGAKPAIATIRFKRFTDQKSSLHTDNAGESYRQIRLLDHYYVKLTISDEQTRDVIAEQWFFC